jgi:hypothetical protein
MPRFDLWLACLLAGVTALSRVPFRAHLLPHWDVIQFALALREYDVVKHQPHPPGYILYVGLARALDVLLADPSVTLTWLAIGSSAVTVFLVYRLAWSLYGRATAVTAAVGLAASPLFWFYGLLGLSYATEAALATAVAMLVWRMRDGRVTAVYGSAVALGLAGGIRQSLLVLLLPLWLGMAWSALRRWRPLLAGLGVLALVVAAWLVPMVWLTGGPRAYLAAGLELFDSTVRATTLLGDSRGNVITLIEALLLGLGVLLPILMAVVPAAGRMLARRDGPAWLFAGWIVPPLVVYVLLHFGQYGYLCTVLPALYIVVGRALVALGDRLAGATVTRRALSAVLLGVAVVAHAGFFTRAGSIEVRGLEAEPGTESWETMLAARYRFRLWLYTARGLHEHEQVIRTYRDAIRRDFDPSATALVTELGNRRSFPWFRHVRYYLPEYPVYHLRVGGFSRGYLTSQHKDTMAAIGDPDIPLPSSVRRLVWVVDYWNPAVPRPPGLRARPLAYGRWLYVLDLDQRPVEHAGYRLTPVTAVARLR